VWLVIAGLMFHRLWLDIIGAILLVLGGYVFSIGVNSVHDTGVSASRCHSIPASGDRSAPLGWRHLQGSINTPSKNEVLLLGSPGELGQAVDDPGLLEKFMV